MKKSRAIAQYDMNGIFIRVWDSITDAKTTLGLRSHANISSCCNNKINSAHGFIWQFYNGIDDNISAAKKRGEMFKQMCTDEAYKQHIQQKKINTSIVKYGVEHPMQNKDIIQSYKSTSIQKYGTDNPAKNQKVKNKISKTESFNKTKFLIDRFSDKLKFVDLDKNIFTFLSKACGHTFDINRQLLVVRDNNKHTICTVCNDPKSNQRSEIENYLCRLISEDTSLNSLKFDRNINNIIGKHELDIYFEQHKIGIEVNGSKYHNSDFKSPDYHINKTNLFNSVGIQVLHFFDDEIAERPEIVLSIIRHKIGVTNKKIYARNCVIKILDGVTASKFITTNHMQGSVPSAVNIGLYHGDVLVSVMSFGKPRYFMGGVVQTPGKYELLRFCNKLGYSVVGGASKLFKHFIRVHNPSCVISYANRRWSNGNMYEKLGFVFDGFTQPNYYYFFKNRRVYRYTLNKKKLISMGYDKNKTERQITEELGIPRIYDCGNIRYMWNAK